MAKYIFPAIFTPEGENGFSVRFPDVDGCFSSGDDLADALKMANDALAIMLVHYEDNKRKIPVPSNILSLKMKRGEFSSLISVDTVAYRHTLNNMAVKKTLSIPAWLNDAATAAGINFSQTLQDALKERLRLY